MFQEIKEEVKAVVTEDVHVELAGGGIRQRRSQKSKMLRKIQKIKSYILKILFKK